MTQEGTSWPVTSLLLVGVSLGGSIVNYPFVYDRFGGVYFATFLQLLIIIIIMGTMLILAHCADISKASNYHTVLLTMCGKRAQHCTALCILVYCYGISISCLGLIGDQFDRLFFTLLENEFCTLWFLDRRFTITATAIIFILPLCYFKKLDFLKYASILGILAILYPMLLIVYEFYKRDNRAAELKVLPDDLLQLSGTVPAVCFSYQTHENLVPIYAGMKHRNLRDFTKACLLAMLILFLIYSTAGIFGYLTFGRHIELDIMVQYGGSDPVVLACIGALVVEMITTYPVMLLCGRKAIDGLYAGCLKDDASELKRRVSMASLWFVTTVIVAVAVPNLAVSLDIMGCVSSILTFLLPGLCLIALFRRSNSKLHSPKSCIQLLLASLLILCGASLFIISLVQVFFRDLKPGGELSKSYFKCP